MSLYSYDGLDTFIDMGSSRVQERSTQWDNYIIKGHFLKYQVKLHAQGTSLKTSTMF